MPCRIKFADIVPACEFRNIPIQMFDRHLVIRPVIPSFQHTPEGFHTVGMDLLIHVLAAAMPHLLMVNTRQTLDRQCASSVKTSAPGSTLLYTNSFQSLAVNVAAATSTSTRFVSRSRSARQQRSCQQFLGPHSSFLEACLFPSLPPIYVSSTSTGPTKKSPLWSRTPCASDGPDATRSFGQFPDHGATSLTKHLSNSLQKDKSQWPTSGIPTWNSA